jgi:hypothetical protein
MYGSGRMSNQAGDGTVFGLMMTGAAQSRAGQYRERAAQLLELAAAESDDELRGNLVLLAAQYNELSQSLSPTDD